MIRFDQWRLVVRKGETAGTVEVAHEALFREWTRLKGWLEPERARLEALRSLQLDALTWDRNGRDAAFLNHRDKRLAEATALAGIDGYRKRLGTLEFDYLAACQDGRAVGAEADAAACRRCSRRAGIRRHRGPRRLAQPGLLQRAPELVHGHAALHGRERAALRAHQRRPSVR